MGNRLVTLDQVVAQHGAKFPAVVAVERPYCSGPIMEAAGYGPTLTVRFDREPTDAETKAFRRFLAGSTVERNRNGRPQEG